MPAKKEQKASTSKPEKKAAKENLQAPRGMRDFWGESYFHYQGFFEKAAEIALYYGFQPIFTPLVESEQVFTSGIGEGTDIVEKELYRVKTKGSDQLALRPEGTAGVVRAYIENGMHSWPQPVLFYYEGTFYRHDKPQRGRYRELRQFGLEVLGTEKSIADALIIKVMSTILEEAGMSNLVLSINSIGDKECRGNYRRELSNYYKKHASAICDDCDRRLKTNPLRLLDCKVPTCQPIKERAPESITYLCESCKKHFKEVLEYLESMGITYTIDKTLVRGIDYYTRTVFEFVNQVKPQVETPEAQPEENVTPEPALLSLGGGGRYDYLAKLLGSNRDVPAVGAALGVDRIVESAEYNKLAPRIIKKPKMFFIQLGFDAKLKSIPIIEMLRKAKIPILQSLSKDSLGSQLATAEKLSIPYALILGQKEVLEKTVIVRNMENRSQQSVPIDDLPNYIKKL